MDDALNRFSRRMDARLARIERHLAVTAVLLGVPPESGIHVLKDAWDATDYLKEYCELLTPKLQLACDRTRTVVGRYLRSARGLQYLINRNRQKPGTHPEAVLEKRLYTRWRRDALGGAKPLWHKIVQNQVPLKARQESETGLKCIDLLATSEDGIPVVIELKVEHKQCDTPLKALLEAASYACVLQADWPAFSGEWREALAELGVNVELPQSSPVCDLVIAATPDYWAFWRKEHRESVVRARPAFKMLVREFCAIGLPVRFASIDKTTLDVSEYSFPDRHP